MGAHSMHKLYRHKAATMPRSTSQQAAGQFVFKAIAAALPSGLCSETFLKRCTRTTLPRHSSNSSSACAACGTDLEFYAIWLVCMHLRQFSTCSAVALEHN